MSKQRLASEKWHGDIGPRIFKIIEKNKDINGENIAQWAGDLHYQVTNIYVCMYVLDRLGQITCSCGRWDLSSMLLHFIFRNRFDFILVLINSSEFL